MKYLRNFSFITAASFIMFSCNTPNGTQSRSEIYADSLLNIMTLEEKIGQLTLFTSGWDVTGPTLRDTYREDIVTGKCGNLFNAHTVAYNMELQELAVNETRLGIPLLFGYDVIHGHRTIYPVPIGEACSWDSVLVEKSARLAALEASASGINWGFNPMVDISRDPRWGRVAEGSGEDVLLGSIFSRAKVRGFQGEDLSDPSTLAACVKHFAAYGAPQAGRDYHTVDMSKRVFLEDYYPPYKAAFDVGVASLMTSFNELFGVPASGSKYLLDELLRKEEKYEGLVVTDYGSIYEMVNHGYAADIKHSAELAINAGVDMDMQGAAYYKYMVELLDEGKVEIEKINQAVKRVLVLKYDLGLFEDPYRYLDLEREEEIVLSDQLFDHALYAGERSIVLLKNEEYRGEKILPIKKTYPKIAVLGPLAENKIDMLGSWHASGSVKEMITLTEAIENKFPGSRVYSEKGVDFSGENKEGFSNAIKLARNCDLVILAIGENYQQSGEAASRTKIGLPGVQQEFVEEINKLGKPVVAVIFAGRPLTIGWMQENISSIVYAWQPGSMAGQAIANVLSGDYNPSAKITMTFPMSVGQIPLHYDMKNTGRPNDGSFKYQSKYIDSPNSPLYPFGYGISYTSFDYSEISLSDTIMSREASLTASIVITNTGKYQGEEIVQLYIRDMVASITPPVKKLKGFHKISLEPGESKEVSFELKIKDLEFMNGDFEYITEPGSFRLFIGPDSENCKISGFSLTDS